MVVGICAIGSALVIGVPAGTAAHESRREHAGPVSCLDHLGHNPEAFVGVRGGTARPRFGVVEQLRDVGATAQIA